MAKPKRDYDKINWEVSWTTLGRGCWIMCCWSTECQKPLGHILFSSLGVSKQSKKHRAEILGSHVEPWARRLGVRTFLQRMLFKHWGVDVVCSQNGSKYGFPWMQARGYQIEPVTGMWYVTREMFEASLGTPQ